MAWLVTRTDISVASSFTIEASLAHGTPRPSSCAAGNPGVGRVRALAVEGARLLDLGGHLGDGEPQRLEVGDRVTELLPLLQVDDRVLQRGAGQADGAGGGVHAGGVEELLRLGEAGLLGGRTLLVALLPGGPGLVDD